jgi:hypothetical protein
MKLTGTATVYLLIFYVVGIFLNALQLIDYNAPVIIDILKALGICFAFSLFLRLLKVGKDTAFFTGILFAYVASVVLLYLDSGSRMILVNLIIAIALSLIFTKK